MPNPMMIPQRTIYTPQQPGVVVSIVPCEITDDFEFLR